LTISIEICFLVRNILYCLSHIYGLLTKKIVPNGVATILMKRKKPKIVQKIIIF